MTDVLITAGELAEFLKKEPCVVIDTRNPEAYGAGHLAGTGSVQQQLARLGLKVERVWQ